MQYAWKLREPADQIGGDRRLTRRYHIEMGVQWKLIHRKKVLDAGEGRTLDLSSGGLLFETDCKLPVGLKVSLSIAWPFLLHNAAPLQLKVEGRIVRSDGGRIAVRTLKHELHTAGAAVEQAGEWPFFLRVPFDFRALESPLGIPN